MVFSVGRVYALAICVVAVLDLYVWLFHQPVPYAPFTLIAFSAGALTASATSRRYLLPEHTIRPGLINPSHVRLYLPKNAYLGFWLCNLMSFGFWIAGMVALGSSQERSSSLLLLLTGWWIFEFYFAAALLMVGVVPALSSGTQ